MEDDDFLPATQFHLGRRQPTQRPSQSQMPSSSQDPQLSSSDITMLHSLVQQLKESQRGVKRPAEKNKPLDKKPKLSEEFKCVFKNCKSVLKTKVNLFRHMKNMHDIMDPERVYGCTMDNTIVNLDESLMEHKCLHCEFVTTNINAMDAHNATIHGVSPSLSCKVCSFKTSSSADLAVHSRSHIASTSTAPESFKDKLHKCNDCLCYFEEKSTFDEHLKEKHGFEAECKICKKNFRFKDFDSHVKSSHPDVYDKKNNVKAKEKIVKVTLKLKSGKVKHVFKCQKCSARFDDENKAQRHVKVHDKGLKAKVVNEERVVKNVQNQKDPPPENNLLFVCETCDIACVSYDAAVQHSQNHITKPKVTFVTETCDTCQYKFESICFNEHVTRHYEEKHLKRESFKTVSFKFNLLLSKDWIDSFNSDIDIKKIEAQSIYGSTRSVKMRVISASESSKTFDLYQCGKCDTFVEPTSVTNHTLNYDTCTKIKHANISCSVCKRKFNTSFLRDKHEKVHKFSSPSFRIIVFNAERDKEFNDILNDPKTGLMLQKGQNHADTNNNQDEVINIERDEVLYKCMCGLCFVSKRKAEDHTKVCPGRDTKQNCPKCNSLFNISELVSHLEQHLNGATRFKIEDFIPEPICIDIDENEEEIKGNKDIKVEHSLETNNDITVFEVLDSDEEIERTSQAVPNIRDEQTNTQAEAMPGTSTPNADIPKEEIEDEVLDYESDEQIDYGANQDVELTLDDSQNVSSEPVEDQNPDRIRTQTESLQLNSDVTNTNDKIKCIPTSQLLGSVHDNDYSRSVENSTINVRSEIEAVKRDIATDEVLVATPTTVKQEKPWLLDPTDYSYIGPRPSFRQIDISHTNIVTYTIEETDDEDDLFLELPSGSQLENDFNERNSNTDVTNDIPSAGIQTADNTDEEIHTYDTILAHDTFNSIETVASEEQPENGTERSKAVENYDKDENNIAQSNTAIDLNGGLGCITNKEDSEGIDSMRCSNDQTSSLRQSNHNLGDTSYYTETEEMEDEMNAIEGPSESHDAEIGTVEELSLNEVSSYSHEKNPKDALTVSDKDDLPGITDIKSETYDEFEIKNKLITQNDQVEITSDYSKEIQFKMEPKEVECQREYNSGLMQVRNEPIDFALDLRNVDNENRLIQRNDNAIVSYRNDNVEWNIRDVASIGPSVEDLSLHTHAYSHNYSRRALNEIDSNENRVMRRPNRTLNVPSFPEVAIQGGPNNRRNPFANDIDDYEFGRRTGHGPGFGRNDAVFQNAGDVRNNRVDFNLSVVLSDQNVMGKPNNACCIS